MLQSNIQEGECIEYFFLNLTVLAPASPQRSKIRTTPLVFGVYVWNERIDQ